MTTISGGQAGPLGSGEAGSGLAGTMELLGGAKVLKVRADTRMAAHELLARGLPGTALTYLVERLTVLAAPAEVERAVGISLRTLQRRRGAPAKLLSVEQSGRTWKFAEILAKATDIFGSQEEAERWFARPAMGLDDHRPIDLLSTPAGIGLVEEFLGRLDYGVYA